MTEITLEAVKARQDELGAMIARLEEAAKAPTYFEYQGQRIALSPGERYAGTIISADGARSHHIILMSGEAENKTWADALTWAESIGGALPDRVEGALLFATMQDEFQREAYWTREQHASASVYAWYQDFCYGDQYYSLTGLELRARAVRRLIIQ